MNSQTHPGLPRVGGGVSRTRRGVTAPMPRPSLLAAVVIEAIVAVTLVVMGATIGNEDKVAPGQPGAAPFVTPAPETQPTPRPGF